MSKRGTAIDWANAIGVALTLAAATVALWESEHDEPVVAMRMTTSELGVEIIEGPEGPSLRDAAGHLVPVGDYQRVVAASTLSTSLAIRLLEVNRIAAVARRSAESPLDALRIAGIPTVERAADIEAILAMEADLVLVHAIGAPPELERLRERGVRVFDFGGMSGVDAYVSDALVLATLLGAPERGQSLRDRFLGRLRSVADDVAPERRPRALYIGLYGTDIFGGSEGSSYHDVLRFAGLRDAAAHAFEGWPRYSRSDLLSLDPEIIVTSEGRGAQLCAIDGLESLRACDRLEPGIIELPESILSDPGPGVLEAAERLREIVHGPLSGPGPLD